MARKNDDHDFRVECGFFGHPKTRRLVRELGTREAVLAVIQLWAWARQHCPDDGDLAGLDAIDVAEAAEWPGDADAFVAALSSERIRFLDGEPGAWRLHDWSTHQPWAAKSTDRSARAQHAARKRWSNRDRGEPDDAAPRHATGTESDAGSTENDAASMRNGASGNAPDPTRPEGEGEQAAALPTPEGRGRPARGADRPEDRRPAAAVPPRRESDPDPEGETPESRVCCDKFSRRRARALLGHCERNVRSKAPHLLRYLELVTVVGTYRDTGEPVFRCLSPDARERLKAHEETSHLILFGKEATA